MRCVWILGFLVTSLTAQLAWGQEAPDTSGTDHVRRGRQSARELLKKLSSKDSQVRDEGQKALLEDSQEVISGLLALVDDKRLQKAEPQIILTAMRTLGELRARKAAGSIVQLMAFRDIKQPLAPTSERSYPPKRVAQTYVGVQAAIEIGMPSVREILENARRFKDPTDQCCASAVLKHVLGIEAARVMLENRIAKLPEDSPGRTRFLKIAEYLSYVE